MEIGKQIKKHRMAMQLSQEELADKVYVSRQTISNWETDKSYPDIHSVLLLSSLFQISPNTLIQGDLEMMNEIQEEEVQKMKRLSGIFGIMILITVLSIAPLFYYLELAGVCIIFVLFMITLMISLQIEKLKKNNNVQSYKEIEAFLQGETLEEIQRYQEFGKRPYQKLLLTVGSGVITFIIVSFMLYLIAGK